MGIPDAISALFIGFIACACLYGVTCAQSVFYFRSHWGKKSYLSSSIVLLWILDTVHAVMISHSLYVYLVENRAISSALMRPVWSIMLSVIPSSISIGIVQYVWIMRIWTLNRHKRRTLIAYCMLSLVVLEWVASIVLLVRVFCISSFGIIPSITWLVAAEISLMTINDLISSSYFCYLLHTSRDGLCATDTLINKLMIYGVNTGLLTCLGSLSLLAVLITQPEKSYYMAIYVVVPKLYINSLLAMANWRSSVLSSTIRRTSQGEVSLQLTTVQLSTLSRCTQYEYTGT